MEVEKEIPALKIKLSKDDMNSKEFVEFAIDTFKIEKTAEKRIDIDYSTVGMNNAIDDLRIEYDKLLNKYYNKLLKSLKSEDKKSLVNAQKAWINFRDSEQALVGILTKEIYSGGGTIQSNISMSNYCSLFKQRTIELFNYYDQILKH